MGERQYIWGHDRRFNAYSNYIREKFGGRIQKLSVNAGFTCPNRDGKVGIKGCTFCNNKAFNPSYCTPDKSVTQQLEEGISFHRKRYRRSTGYFAYFQAFSNTYGQVDHLRNLYTEALKVEGIRGLAIGTRPDCVDDNILALLAEISSKTYVSLELGIESVYNKTLEFVNRGHSVEVAIDAVKRAHKAGIETGGHFIFGLPGESVTDMMGYANVISRLPLTTVKFHQLQIIKDTVLEQQFKDDPSIFASFTWEEYRDFFISFLEELSPQLIIERFTGEAPPSMLAGSRWGKKRADVLMSLFEERMEEIDSWQGKNYDNMAVATQINEELR